ncbi:GAF domain-containing protein [Pseudomonas stutzeri]|uniref:GAF domain-containing protein n=1 Tax=Stutzerimonas stutzeri TaxID=316 RepID=UPI001F52A484|nr:GAF domain-containing protein [Stutzerimonas stutzeri]MCI0915946.1 GAF domain-containing protein [Stutzerimonas stutzeri]
MKTILLILGLIARLATIGIPIFVFNKHKETFILPLKDWSNEAIIQITLSLAFLITADYIKDFVKSYKTKKTFNPLQRASRETGATVTTLLQYGRFESKDCAQAIESALRQIETIVEVSLGKSRREGHEISANCMIYRTQRKVGPSLTLTHWGTRLAGREPITIKLGNNLPGAPRAIEENKTHYIRDTQSKEFHEFFENKSYKSIISIPLTAGQKNIGVINIDSTEANAFGNISSFNKDTHPLIQPQLDTIKKLIQIAEFPENPENPASSPDNHRHGG